jgi:integrase
LKVNKNYLDQVRDVFCFCCFTGLRYSDVYNLKHSNIKGDTIEITTIKTEDPLIIELNQYSKTILAKYKDMPYEDDKCLPVISNQKFNVYLKELGQEAKFNEPESIVYYKGNERKEDTFPKWKLLSTHVGRKTFVSNAIYFNIPAEVIMSWTGHKDHKILENYYKITGKQKRREMDKFNNEKGETNEKE